MDKPEKIIPVCDNCGTWVNVTRSRDNIYRCGKCRVAIMTFLIDQLNRIKKDNGHRYTLQSSSSNSSGDTGLSQDIRDIEGDGEPQ